MVSAAHIAISSATRGHVHSGSSGEPADAAFVFGFVLPILILVVAVPLIIIGWLERQSSAPTVYHPMFHRYYSRSELAGFRKAFHKQQRKLTPAERNARIVSQMESLGLTLADYTDAELAAMGYTHDQGLD